MCYILIPLLILRVLQACQIVKLLESKSQENNNNTNETIWYLVKSMWSANYECTIFIDWINNKLLISVVCVAG